MTIQPNPTYATQTPPHLLCGGDVEGPEQLHTPLSHVRTQRQQHLTARPRPCPCSRPCPHPLLLLVVVPLMVVLAVLGGVLVVVVVARWRAARRGARDVAGSIPGSNEAQVVLVHELEQHERRVDHPVVPPAQPEQACGGYGNVGVVTW